MTELNPAQQAVADGLLNLGGARPPIDPSTYDAVRDEVTARLQFAADALQIAGERLFVNKHAISTVLDCELRWTDGSAFAWTRATATGSVAHETAELSLMGKLAREVGDGVDGVIEDHRTAQSSLGVFLNDASPTELAAVRSRAVTAATTIIDGFPPIGRSWHARAEQSFGFSHPSGVIQLSARPDLALGRPQGPEARSLLIDFKTGRRSQIHIDDMRFYALVFTLRWGVPPWRVVTFYAADGTWVAEDVDLDLLRSAARRTTDAVLMMAELIASKRPAGVTPCPACTWCQLKASCAGAVTWAEKAAQIDDALSYGDEEDELPAF